MVYIFFSFVIDPDSFSNLLHLILSLEAVAGSA